MKCVTGHGHLTLASLPASISCGYSGFSLGSGWRRSHSASCGPQCLVILLRPPSLLHIKWPLTGGHDEQHLRAVLAFPAPEPPAVSSLRPRPSCGLCPTPLPTPALVPWQLCSIPSSDLGSFLSTDFLPPFLPPEMDGNRASGAGDTGEGAWLVRHM